MTGRAKRSQDIKFHFFFYHLSLPFLILTFFDFDYYGDNLVPPLRREFLRI